MRRERERLAVDLRRSLPRGHACARRMRQVFTLTTPAVPTDCNRKLRVWRNVCRRQPVSGYGHRGRHRREAVHSANDGRLCRRRAGPQGHFPGFRQHRLMQTTWHLHNGSAAISWRTKLGRSICGSVTPISPTRFPRQHRTRRFRCTDLSLNGVATLTPYSLGSVFSGRYVAARLTIAEVSTGQPVNNLGGGELRLATGPSDVVLEVNRSTGSLACATKDSVAQALSINGYEITSADGSLLNYMVRI